MSEYVPVDLQRQVRARFQNACAYCRSAEQLTVSLYEIEHIIPRSAGGETEAENLCLACPTCNRFKADRRQFSDPVTGQDAPLFHPNRDVWARHFQWNASGTEIIARTPIGRATIAALRMNRAQLIRVRRMWVAIGEHPPVG